MSSPYRSISSTARVSSLVRSTNSTTNRRIPDRFAEVRNIQDFGATTDAEDNTTAIQAAIDACESSGGGRVFVPPGTWVAKGRIYLKDQVDLYALGSQTTTLDMREATVATAFISASGTLTELPGLGSAVSIGDDTITFATAPDLEAGDVYILHDTDDNSYSSYRTYYRQGEFLRAKSVDGVTVSNVNRTYAAYSTGATRKLFKVNPVRTGISGLKILFKPATLIAGIRIENGVGCHFSDLDLSGNQYVHLSLYRCFECTAQQIRAFDVQTAVGYNYGIAISNSQRIMVGDCHLDTSRHGYTVGGGDADGDVVCRELVVSSSFIAGQSHSYGLDFHGNAEHMIVANCILPNGIGWGGDHITVTGCDIGNDNASAYAFVSSELKGNNVNFTGNKVRASKDFSSGLVCHIFRDGTDLDGVFHCAGNTVDIGGFTHSSGAASDTSVILVGYANGANTASELTAVIENNTITATTAPALIWGIYVRPYTGYPIKRAVIRNNTLVGCGIRADANIADGAIVENDVFDAADRGVYVGNVTTADVASQQWDVSRNRVRRSHSCGIDVRLHNTDYVRIVGNHSVNNAQTATASAQTDSSVYVANAGDVLFTDNTVGDTEATPTQQYTYVIAAVVNLYATRNHNVGRLVNSLTYSHSSITNNRANEFFPYASSGSPASGTATYGPSAQVLHRTPSKFLGWVTTTGGAPGSWAEFGLISNGNLLSWDSTLNTMAVGTTPPTSELVPFRVERNTNGAVQLNVRNRADLGNTSAAATVNIQAVDASGFVGATPSDYTNVYLRQAFLLKTNSDAARICIAADSPNQTIDFFAGGSDMIARLDSTSSAGTTRLLVWDQDTGALARVRVGANGTGPGGTGRALYFDDI